MNILERLKNLFKTNKDLEIEQNIEEAVPIRKTREDIMGEIDYSQYDSVVHVCGTGDKALLILDDIPMTYTLYKIDFDKIILRYGIDACDKFKVYKSIGKKAGPVAYNWVFNEKNKVDCAILDLTLGYTIRIDDDYIEFDGVDIALAILKINPDARVLFSTAHTLNKSNPTVFSYWNKFESATGKKFQDHYLDKNSDRVKVIHDLLYGGDDDDKK